MKATSVVIAMGCVVLGGCKTLQSHTGGAPPEPQQPVARTAPAVKAPAAAGWSGSWSADITLRLEKDGGQPRFSKKTAVLAIAEDGDAITLTMPDWPTCTIRGTRNGTGALTTPGQICTDQGGGFALELTVTEGIISVDDSGLGVLIKFDLVATPSNGKPERGKAELLATATR
jgi:hypothetical protein